MSSNFRITVNDGHGVYNVTLTEGAVSANSLTLNGRRYAVIAKEDELSRVLETLNILYPGAVTSAKSLTGRVSRSEASVLGLEQAQGGWLEQEGIYLAGLKRSFAKAFLAKPDANPEEFKGLLLQKSTVQDFESSFNNAIAARNIELFLPLLDHVSEAELCQVIRKEKLNVPMRQDIPFNQWIFTTQALKELEQYVRDKGFSGAITLQDANAAAHSIASEEIDPRAPFAIHSVGKVYTGVLALQLIHKNVIDETILDRPVQLDPLVFKALPANVQKHLEINRITLRQLMLHQGGLGEYLDNYIDAIVSAIQSGIEPPQMSRPEDFLKYAEDETYPEGEEKYSNLGLLLVGLSLQHLSKKPFDALLQEYIIDPAKINRFSSQKPKDGIFNPSDRVAGYICGSPAGGYWTTSADLCKFGAWVCRQCKDPIYLRLIEMYGGEFYKNGELIHGGYIPSSSAYLSAFPKHDVIISIVSDGPDASDVIEVIKNHMLCTTK